MERKLPDTSGWLVIPVQGRRNESAVEQERPMTSDVVQWPEHPVPVGCPALTRRNLPGIELICHWQNSQIWAITFGSTYHSTSRMHIFLGKMACPPFLLFDVLQPSPTCSHSIPVAPHNPIKKVSLLIISVQIEHCSQPYFFC